VHVVERPVLVMDECACDPGTVLVGDATSPTAKIGDLGRLISLASRLPSSTQRAISALAPTNGNFMPTKENGLGGSGRMSQINHECIGNCSHYCDAKQDLRLLVSARNIAPGEEITISL
jgi:SET domain